ncbi:MAG: hypothetical protein MUW56_22625 [Chryseobacterium sp.]|uniref:polymer-forming cytoskeletal protein n=1 Tax=Chryseobacterium sp. TaxID=1871047 RepID=UPI0025BBB2E3|nr:polymer-forming cytoskeletal protein [Chryseobacterium sp.]MCJ7936351.1 hypothetical protein [Chryseobacterium sp.]
MIKELQKLTKDQLYQRLKENSENLFSTIHSVLEGVFFNEDSLDEEDLSDFLDMLDEETAQKIKLALQEDTGNDEPDIFLMDTDSETSLDLITKEGEGYQIILLENDIHLSGNLFVEDHIVLIVAGHIKAENVIVNGSLYCSGSLTCNVLFGASSNDHETHIEGNIKAALVAENGHYTMAEGDLHARYLLSFYNEIEGKKGKFIDNLSLERQDETALLNPEILDKEGYFDEGIFLNYIEHNTVDTLFGS